jgi:hypothetical protein
VTAILLRLNPWLSDILECQATKIINRHTCSELRIESADVASSFGWLIDFAIFDEVSHAGKHNLWDSAFSAIAKRRLWFAGIYRQCRIQG